MGLTAHPVVNKQKSFEICAAFLDGFSKVAKPGSLKRLQGGVFYGINATNYESWRIRLSVKDTFYYIDNSYFDRTRGTHYRVTRNAIQYHGPWESDGARWAALGYELKPWRYIGGGHVVVCPQSDTFMQYTARYKGDWLAETLAALHKTYPGREIRVRPWSSNKPEIRKTLHDDLAGAGLLATHSSAAAVEAVVEGVPILVSSASALGDMQMDQRVHYLQALADNQWTLDEISNGDAWRWLNR